MDLNLILIILVIIFIVIMVILLIRGDRDRSKLNRQLIEFSEMSQRLAQEQTQSSIAAQAELKGRMEQGQTSVNEQLKDLVSSILPPSAYEFQVTMSNNKRADCVLDLPNPPGPIVIDSKFPLESYHLLRKAHGDTDQKIALRALGAAIVRHIQDIKEKYIIPGETAESALMFLPSEAIYAELHASLPEIVEKSYRSKVWIVSPTTLMATLNTVRAVLKDVHMREQAGVIQNEVQTMLADVKRLDDRVGKFQIHMRQADADLSQIGTSTEKITKRGERITEIELGEEIGSEDVTATSTPRTLEDS
jgi:DNA recombination protein RmuC